MGYYGGTIIQAHGSESKSNKVLDMLVEPMKEVVLMLIKRDSADLLATALNRELHLNESNIGTLIKIDVSRTMGLFEHKDRNREVHNG